MPHISVRINGVPYGKRRPKVGNVRGPADWRAAIITATSDSPRVGNACVLRVTYFLPKAHIPTNFPHGNDLDNLSQNLFEALNETVFAEAPGKDSCVIALEAMKVIVATSEEAGAQLEILPVTPG